MIEERLADAKAVVVIWSKDAAGSEWVQSEADRARRDGKLVQLRLDDWFPRARYRQLLLDGVGRAEAVKPA